MYKKINNTNNIEKDIDNQISYTDDGIIEKCVDRIISYLFFRDEEKEENIEKEEKVEIKEKNSRLEKMVLDRKKAELADEERSSILQKAIAKVTYKDIEEEKNMEAYYSDLAERSRQATLNYESQTMKKLQEDFKKKYKYSVNTSPVTNKTNYAKKIQRKDTRAAGTSMKDILNSENFKNMWDNTIEEDSLEIL